MRGVFTATISKRCAVFGLLIILALGSSVTLFAQSSVNGQIVGVVHDPTGAVIPNANVVVINDGTGAQYTTRTGHEGGYLVPNLAAGLYTVQIDAPGFSKSIYRQVKVDAGKEYSLTATMQVGVNATETVEVRAGQEQVNTTSAEVSRSITSNQIMNLPLNGRDVITLVQGQPGVAAGGGNARSGVATSINGTRPSWSQVTMDGINVQDLFIRTNALDYMPFRPQTDQIDEFTVNTGNQGANATLGANGVYMVTKSGGNTYHGGVYEYNRNSALAANPWFNNHSTPRTPIPFLNRNEFGGKFGGPILKNKLFFYVHYEALRTRSAGQTNRVVPLNDDYTQGWYRYIGSVDKAVHRVNVITGEGLLSTPATVLGIDPKIQSLFLSKVEAASTVNNTDTGDGLNTAGRRFNQASNNDRTGWGTKIDFDLNQKHHFDYSMNMVHETTLRNDLDPINPSPKVSNDSSPKLFVGAWRWTISNTLINNVRVGGNLVNAPFAVNPVTSNGFLWNNGGGKGTVGGILLSSPDITFMPQGRNPAVHQYIDDMTWVKGSHAFTFGGSFQNQNIYVYNDNNILPIVVTGFSSQAPSAVQLTSGMFPGGISSAATANGIRAFLGGVVSLEQQLFNVSSKTSGFVPNQTSARNLNMKDLSFYVQDKWRLKSNLTLNYGVKWEYLSPYKEVNGLQVGPVYTDPSNPMTTLLDPNGSVDFLKEAWKPQRHNFAPTVGLAWDPFRNGKTAIRGGYTMTYVNDDQYRFAGNAADGNAGLSSTVNPTQTLNGVTSTSLYYPNAFGSLPAVPAPAFKMPRTYADQMALSTTGVVWALDPNVATPKVHEFNLTVEREVTPNMSVAVRYVGTLGRDLLRGIDLNQNNAGINKAFLDDFARARSNLYLCGSANPAATCAARQALTYFPTLSTGATAGTALLSNSTAVGYLQTNQAAALADLYVQNRKTYAAAPAAFLPNPGIYAVDYGKSGGFTSYHSLQVEFNRRLSHGLQFQSNYTWSKLLTDSPTGDSGQTRFDPYLDNARPYLQKAPADYDIRHIMHANLVYDLPIGKGKMLLGNANSVLDHLVGGWQLSNIFTLQSGSNFSITNARGTFNRRTGYMTATSNLSQNDLKKLMGTYIAPNGNVYFIDPRVTDPSNQNRAVPVDTLSQAASTSFNQVFFNATAGNVGNLGLLAFTGPAFLNLDAGLAKNTQITERVKFQIRIDAFNVLNHPTFAMLDTDINSTTFGRMTGTQTSARRIQIGGRIDF